MRILNIGIREVILLLLIMLILFGPKQMQENARKLAQTIRRFVRSDAWRTFLGMYDDVNAIKDEMIRESGIREVQDSLRGVNRELNSIDRDLRQTDFYQTPESPESIPEPEEKSPETTKTHEPDAKQL